MEAVVDLDHRSLLLLANNQSIASFRASSRNGTVPAEQSRAVCRHSNYISRFRIDRRAGLIASGRRRHRVVHVS